MRFFSVFDGCPSIRSVRSCSGEKITSRTSRYWPRVRPFSSSSSMVTLWRYVYWLRSFSFSVSRSATSLARLGGGSLARRSGVEKRPDVRMSPMTKTSSGWWAALLVGWTALCGIGIWYARSRGIPGWAAWPALAAILVEYPFYLVAGFPSLRERLSGDAWRLPAFAVTCAVLPYLVC